MHKISLSDKEARCDCGWYYVSYSGHGLRVRQHAATHCVQNAPAVILKARPEKR